LDSSIQAHLGQQLRAWYGNPAETKLPHSLTRLLHRLAQAIRAHTDPVDQEFIDGVLASVTSLRAFAISLTRDADQAEDLVQETVLRAISKHENFEAGTNLQAWLFIPHYGTVRAAKRGRRWRCSRTLRRAPEPSPISSVAPKWTWRTNAAPV
jgi:DNA-directed RNA polymerase specialized sigma24 family protein